MKVIEKKLSEIKPYEKNPRHNEEAVQYVAESIKQFGIRQPIVIDKDNVIVAGHTRYLAAKQLKLKTFPCVMADDLPEEKIRAYRLADNKTAEKASWDIELLDMELAEIETIDMTLLGFDEPEQTEQKINVGGELNTDSFSDDKFECTCPKCGFKFNPRGNEDV